MVERLIKSLREEYNIISEEQGLGEENIKINLIRDVFLRELGYDVKRAIYEMNTANGAVDIIFNVGNEKLTVETKAGDHKIVYKDIEQLIRYLNTQGREWGILTNGQDYILLNSKIETVVNEKNEAHYSNIVFWFNIFSPKDLSKTRLNYFSYLSKESIFEKKTTNYFKDIAQYKTYNFEQENRSWNSYKSTLYTFFDFCVKERGKVYRERALEKIAVEDFEEYINFKSNGKKLSSDTIKNNWSHINSMLLTFKSKGRITYNPFGEGRKTYLGNEVTNKLKSENYLTEDNVSQIISYFATKRDAARNIAGFLLCAIMGFERSDIICMEWENVDLAKGVIKHRGRNLKCPNLLLDCLNFVYKEKVKNKNKLPVVFCTHRNRKNYPFGDVTLNDIFDRIHNIDRDDAKWKDFSPKYVKNCSIQAYFTYNYTIDEILYWTGCDFGQISDYLSMDDVFAKVEKGKGLGNHKTIFEDILNTKLTEWIS